MTKYFMIIFSLILTRCVLNCDIPNIWAQDHEEFTLEEITVTAEKRVENLQKVAMSVSVLNGEDLMNNGVTSLADIIKNIPNVSFYDSGMGQGGLVISIRGLGNDLTPGSGESSVSTNVDGAYEARGESTLFGYFDIERVEVLRGPQGTLYGRNSSGGVLNIVSAKPRTDKVEGYASLDVGSYDKKRIEGAINTPITDRFAARFAFVSSQQDAITHDARGYSEDLSGLGARLQLRYVPNDDAYINFSYNYSKKSGSSWDFVYKAKWDAGIYDVNAGEYPYNLTSRNKTENTKLSLTAEFPLGPGILTAIPTYETSKGLQSGYSSQPGPVANYTFSIHEQPFDYTAKIAEVRYANKSDSKIIWTVGLYYTKTDDIRDPNYIPSMPMMFSSQESTSEAAFGQVTYPFSDALRVIAGARYNKDKKAFYDAINSPDGKVSDSGSFSYFDYKLGIENDFSKDIMGYFTLASGHKPGGFNSTNMPNAKPTFDEESNTSGELGVKSRLLDNRLQVNADIFYYIYKGYQVIDAYFIGNEMYQTFLNADEVQTKGAEFETTALVGNATQLTLNLTYLQNEYTKDFWIHQNAFDISETNQKGSVMPHSPKFSVLANIDHEFSFSDGSALMPKVSFKWVDKQYASESIRPETLEEAYSVVDFAMNYTSSKTWSLNFYVNNVLNKHYYNRALFTGSKDTIRIFPGDPRKFGAVFNIKF